jgi:hypothetical protein
VVVDDRQERDAAGRHVARDRPVEQVDVTEDIAASVEEQRGGAGLRTVLGVPAQVDLRAVVGGRVVLAGGHVGRDRLGGASGADNRLAHGAAPGDVADGGWGEARLGHRRQG